MRLIELRGETIDELRDKVQIVRRYTEDKCMLGGPHVKLPNIKNPHQVFMCLIDDISDEEFKELEEMVDA